MDQTVIDKIKASFARQSYMTTLGAALDHIEKGSVTIRAPMSDHILQQHGFAHAGAAFSMGDSAAGYAALTLMPAEAEVLTTEMKINLLAPASGDVIMAKGRVIKAGRRLTIVGADVFAITGDQEKYIAILQGTMISS
jgi:uncharacterized protein (TIGR00369 family)